MPTELIKVRLSTNITTATNKGTAVLKHKDGISIEGSVDFFVNVSDGTRSEGEGRPFVVFELTMLNPHAKGHGSRMHVAVVNYWGNWIDPNNKALGIDWQGGVAPARFQQYIATGETDFDFMYAKIMFIKTARAEELYGKMEKFEFYDVLRRNGEKPPKVGDFITLPDITGNETLKELALRPYRVGDRFTDQYTTYIFAGEMHDQRAIALAFAQAGMVVYNKVSNKDLNSPAMIEADRVAGVNRVSPKTIELEKNVKLYSVPSSLELELGEKIEVLSAEMSTLQAENKKKKDPATEARIKEVAGQLEEFSKQQTNAKAERTDKKKVAMAELEKAV